MWDRAILCIYLIARLCLKEAKTQIGLISFVALIHVDGDEGKLGMQWRKEEDWAKLKWPTQKQHGIAPFLLHGGRPLSPPSCSTSGKITALPSHRG